MTKKKFIDFKNPGVIIGFIALFGALGTGVVTLARYITLPTRVEAVEEKTEKIEDYIREQRISNELLQKMVEKGDDEIVMSADGKTFYDKTIKSWRPIKFLNK